MKTAAEKALTLVELWAELQHEIKQTTQGMHLAMFECERTFRSRVLEGLTFPTGGMLAGDEPHNHFKLWMKGYRVHSGTLVSRRMHPHSTTVAVLSREYECEHCAKAWVLSNERIKLRRRLIALKGRMTKLGSNTR